MKNLTIGILLLLLNVSLYSNEQIKSTFLEYFAVMNTKDFDKALDYMYPKFFEIAPKDLMVQQFESSFNNPDMMLSMANPEIISISEVKNIESENLKFATVSYKFDMIFDFSNSGNPDALDATFGIFQTKYGEENVSKDSENKTITTRTDGKMFALSSPEFDGWKFLENKESMGPMFKSILPEEIYE